VSRLCGGGRGGLPAAPPRPAEGRWPQPGGAAPGPAARRAGGSRHRAVRDRGCAEPSARGARTPARERAVPRGGQSDDPANAPTRKAGAQSGPALRDKYGVPGILGPPRLASGHPGTPQSSPRLAVARPFLRPRCSGTIPISCRPAVQLNPFCPAGLPLLSLASPAYGPPDRSLFVGPTPE